MNATTNFTVKSLRANKVRTLVTIAGVASPFLSSPEM